MTTTTVTHKVTLPAQGLLPSAGSEFGVQLCVPAAWDGSSTAIVGTGQVHLGRDGSCVLKLTPNSELNPAGTWYVVTDPDGTTHTIVVPVSADPVTLESCLVDQPEAPGTVDVGIRAIVAADASITVDDDDPAHPTVQVTPGRFILAPGSPADGTVLLRSGGAWVAAPRVPTDGAPLVPATLAGKKLFVVGHSFTLEPGLMCTPGREWMNQLIARAGMVGPRLGFAQASSRPSGGAIATLGKATVATAWSVGLAGAAFIEHSGADYRFGNPASAASLADSFNAYQAMITMFQAASIDQVTAAWSAGDTTLTNNQFWGSGQLHFTASVASPTLVVPIALARALGGKCALLTLVENGNTRTMTVTQDGVTVGTFNKTNQGGVNGVSTKAVVQLSGLNPAGSAQVVVTGSATGAGNVSVEATAYPAANPIPVVVIKDPYFRTTDEATVAANKPAFDAGIDALAGLFTNVIPVDLGFGGWWDADLHLGSDRNHPIDAGMTAITNRLSQVLVAHGL